MFCLQGTLHKLFEGPDKRYCLHKGRQGEGRDKIIRLEAVGGQDCNSKIKAPT